MIEISPALKKYLTSLSLRQAPYLRFKIGNTLEDADYLDPFFASYPYNTADGVCIDLKIFREIGKPANDFVARKIFAIDSNAYVEVQTNDGIRILHREDAKISVIPSNPNGPIDCDMPESYYPQVLDITILFKYTKED